MKTVAFKLADRAEWEAARASGVYGGSPVDRADGFIHMSGPDQLEETARRHYAGRPDLILATIDLAMLGEALRWEPSRGGALFPHLYGPLPFAAVMREQRLSIDQAGGLMFEDDAAAR